MKELEAVNVLLSNIGQAEVNSLTVGHPDVANARKTLDRASRRLQRSGWWFNRDYAVTLEPEAVTKKIRVANTSELELSDYALVQRGDYLYNRSTQSYEFDDNVVATSLIWHMEFDLLPEIAQDVVVYRAGAEFVRDELEDPNKEQALRQDERIAMIALKEEDLKLQRYNVFSRDHVGRARRGVRPYGGHIQRFANTPDH